MWRSNVPMCSIPPMPKIKEKTNMKFAEEISDRIKRFCGSNCIDIDCVAKQLLELLFDDANAVSFSVEYGNAPESPQMPQNASESVDMVNHPSHYKIHANECIDEIRAMLTPEEYRGYLKGSFLKYRYRAGHKGDAQMDFDKSDWYMKRLMQEGEDE